MPEQQSKNQSKTTFISLRQSMFRRFGLLVAASMALFTLGYLLFGLRPIILSTAELQFKATTNEVESSLLSLFNPVENLIGMARDWVQSPDFDFNHPDRFNRIFQPLLKQIPQITSVVAGNDKGQGCMLLQQTNDRWHNRLTDIPQRGRQQHYFDWQGSSLVQEYFQEADYDPRLRPWYTGAMQQDRGGLHWTQPYTFYTTKDPGITVSCRTHSSDGQELVIGFDIMLLDVSRGTAAMEIGENGFVVVLTSDQRVLGLPRSFRPPTPEQFRLAILKSVAEFPSEALQKGVASWQKQQQPATQIIHFEAGNRPWLGKFSPFRLDELTFWVASFAPSADFIPPWEQLLNITAIIFILGFLLTLMLAHHQSRHLSIPLEYLAKDSEKIAHLDFAESPPLQSRLLEIHLLAQAHAKMRTTLNHFHQTVENQAGKLQDQIVDLRRAQKQIKESEMRLQQALNEEEAILDNALVGILLVKNRTIVSVNRRLYELFGYRQDEMIGKSTEILYASYNDFVKVGERVYNTQAPKTHYIEEFLAQRKDGSKFWIHLSGQVLDINNPHGGSVWVIADLTEQKEAQNRLEYLDHHDPLTDLPNRLLFHDRLSHAIIRAARDREKLAILFLDLDHFKAINDSLGHYAGDQLLNAVAERLQKNLRESDTLARHGGDEFIILIEKITEDITIVSLAEKLLHQLAVPFDIGKHTFYITLSIGISLYPADGHDSATLLRNADAAMHQAKARGRNAYHFYSEEITRNALERVEMEKQLRQAVKLNELEIHYQPQVNAQNGHISGAEALVRWKHPEKGLIPPSAFIPLAEETGIIQDLGYYVLEQSCNFWAGLVQKGLTLPLIAVNFSVKQLHQDNLVGNIRNLIKKTGIPPQALEIEITESFFLEPEKAFNLLFELGQLGLSLALDDFGIGYSSLNYLKQLPFRKLKIDQSFIRDIGRSSDGEVLVRTIISMARSLGREVLAEGVETQQQMDFLLEEGCPTMQGYFFAKPMPGGEFSNWYAKRLMVSPTDQASCL